MPPSRSTVPRSRKGKTTEKLHSKASLGNWRFQAFLQRLAYFDTSVMDAVGPLLGLGHSRCPGLVSPKPLFPGSFSKGVTPAGEASPQASRWP